MLILKVTFDNSAQAENLANFPVLVKLSSSNFDFTKAKTNGEDIRFTDSNGTTELSDEIESWSAAGQAAVIWVKVPQIDLSSATDYIYAYYGNASASDGQAATSVWTNGYVGVWHMKQDPSGGAPQILDSTSNAYHGTNAGGLLAGDLVTGYIGNALEFDGAGDDYFTLPDIISNFSANNGTFEAWTQAVGASNGFISGLGDASQTSHYPYSGADDYIDTFRSSRVGFNDGGFVKSNWHYLTIKTTSGGDWVMAQNLNVVNTTAATNISITTIPKIGQTTGANWSYVGAVDELRLSNVARSNAWLAAQYKSTNNTFNTFGAENEVPSPLSNSGNL